jgi:predicted nucleotidyltransferase
MTTHSVAVDPPCVRANTGVFATEREALAAVVGRMVHELDPHSIWLFGSRARGEQRPDSDFDLLVVAKPGGFGSGDYERVHAATRGFGVACDVVPCSAEDFVIAQMLETTLVSQVLAHGRLIFEAETHQGVSGHRAAGSGGGAGAGNAFARAGRVLSAAVSREAGEGGART